MSFDISSSGACQVSLFNLQGTRSGFRTLALQPRNIVDYTRHKTICQELFRVFPNCFALRRLAQTALVEYHPPPALSTPSLRLF